MNKPNLLQRVRVKLAKMERPAMVKLSGQCEVGIDTIRRIKLSAAYDPVYSRVQRLADALGVR